MSTIYTPNPTLLGDITLISDGDLPAAAGVNTPIEACADGIAYLQSRVIERVDILLNSSGFTTWTPGANTTSVEVSGCGSGGAGGGGAAGNTTTARAASGGGGGGSAPWSSHRITVTPGVAYSFSVANGVTGGAAGADGGHGGSTTFGNGTNTITFPGGGGGKAGSTSTTLGTVEPVSRGGLSPRADTTSSAQFPPAVSGLVPSLVSTLPVGVGGCGAWSASSIATICQGGGTNCGYGGLAGAQGAASGSYNGGGAGGGGGGFSHPGTITGTQKGAAGGNGGAANSSGAGAAGTAGGSAAGNILGGAGGYGAGGGGGGGGGHGSTAGGAGGAGGASGEGILIIRYVGPQAVIA
jgi:hypothetical protein